MSECRAYRIEEQLHLVRIEEQQSYTAWRTGIWPRFPSQAETCEVISLSRPGLTLPNAVRRKIAPKWRATLARAIQSQGLTTQGRTVEVPFYSDMDGGLFIAITEPSGSTSVLAMSNMDPSSESGWWKFGPFRSGGSAHSEREVAARIRKHRLMLVRQDGIAFLAKE